MERANRLAGNRRGKGGLTAVRGLAPIAALFLIGCGGGSSLPGTATRPVSQSPPGVATPSPRATARTVAPNASGNDATADLDQRVTVRTDSQGRKWLGDVPYDVFFNDPLKVAAEGGPASNGVENRSVAAAPATSAALPKTPNAMTAANPAEKTLPDATKSVGPSQNDWIQLVEIDILDAEVKRIRNELAAQLQSVGKYNSHYQEIAVDGTALAAAAEITAEHSGSLSWKNNAPLVRDLGMKIHAAASGPGGTAFQATKTPYEQLVDVLDGNVPAGVAASPPRRDFAEVASRDAIMKRMDHSFQWLKKSGSAQQVIKKQSANAIHESSLLAALGRVIAVGHYDSADDPKYKAHADDLSKSAAAVAAAVKSDDAAAFTDAVGRVQKRCDACHADFRFQ